MHTYIYTHAHTHTHTHRGAFTVAVVGSAIVAKQQSNKRRKQQEERGSRPPEKLSWEERVHVEEERMKKEADSGGQSQKTQT